MHVDSLPPVNRGTPMTLVVTYKDGTSMKVPYFDNHGAKCFLESRDDIEAATVKSYTGE